VKLQVNWAQYYPERLSVTGDRAGTTVGPIRIYGETWECTKKFGYPEVTLVFHLAGAGDSAIPNRNPSGFFYVIAEYLPTAPTLSGSLTVPEHRILRGTSSPIGFKITRGASQDTTPPFVGYDQSGEVTFISSN
jgi:hypothetical protein